MDKSFNDQELSDIMKEIEALEDNFQSEEDEATAAFEASPVMEELAEMGPEKALPESCTASPKKAAVIPMAPKAKTSSPQSTSMSFKVSGDLHLDLQFDVGGKCVSLEVNEKGLSIHMEDGMTFSVPLKKTA